MIPLVEDYLSELIQSRMLYLKDNLSHTDKVLGTNQARLDRLKGYLQNTNIKVIKGYPRTPSDLPCICIMLSGEDETQVGLGDYGTDDDIDIRSVTDTVEVISSPGARLAVPFSELPHKPAVYVQQVVNVTKGYVLPEDAYYLANEDLGLVAYTSDDVEHGDQVAITYNYRFSSQELLETLYECNYRLECWAPNGDLTVDLYHLLKWSLLSGRDYLVNKGLFRQKLGGADFEPATSYFPEFVYRRALTFWCQVIPSVPIEQVGYIGGIEVNQTISIDLEG